MLVMFTGGRGSGKSTIARALYSTLDSANVNYVHQATWRAQAKSIYKKAGWILYFLTFFRPLVCRVFFERLYRDIQYDRAKGSLGRIYMPCVFSYHIQRLAKNKEQCVVYESDFLTWAADKALDSAFDPGEVRDFYARVLLPRVGNIIVVVCETPVEEAIERWRIRDDKTLSLEEVRQWIEKRAAWKKARKKVIDVVSTVSGVTVINLSGLDTPDHNANRIKKLMEEAVKFSEPRCSH